MRLRTWEPVLVWSRVLHRLRNICGATAPPEASAAATSQPPEPMETPPARRYKTTIGESEPRAAGRDKTCIGRVKRSPLLILFIFTIFTLHEPAP
jgi:hypothetical protein